MARSRQACSLKPSCMPLIHEGPQRGRPKQLPKQLEDGQVTLQQVVNAIGSIKTGNLEVLGQKFSGVTTAIMDMWLTLNQVFADPMVQTALGYLAGYSGRHRSLQYLVQGLPDSVKSMAQAVSDALINSKDPHYRRHDRGTD